MQIFEFETSLQSEVVQHILEIENEEFNLGLTLYDQPDLTDIAASYQLQGGNFWIALDKGKVIGTIALFNLGNGYGDLRKMFVKQAFRGTEYGLGKHLLNILIAWAITHRYRKIFLETTTRFAAAVRFYQKNDFVEIPPEQLPANFPVIRVAEKFMVRTLV